MNLFKIFKEFFKLLYFDRNEKNFLKESLKKNLINNSNNSNGTVLIELFNWYPLIIFYSFLIKILKKRKNLEIKYYYFQNKHHFLQNFLIFKKISKIYQSFGCFNGINLFAINKKKQNYYKKIFLKKKFNKKKLINYKKKGIVIGDLIYDSYLNKYEECTISNFSDNKLISLFVEANLVFDQIYNFFLTNDVKFTIPADCVYYQHALVPRIAIKFKARNILVFCKGMATSNFSLRLLNKKYALFDYDYFNFKKNFAKLNNEQKIKGFKIGKKFILDRFKGKIDSSISYMRTSGYKKEKNKNIFSQNSKKKIVLFSHDFYDNPHRYRKMIFSDFYDFIYKTALFISNNYQNYELYIKPHPNQLTGNERHFFNLKKIFRNSKNIYFLDKTINNNDIIFSKPDLCLTVHGTIAHELAYKKIITINAGENPHINYNFNLHPKTECEYFDMIKNTKKYKNKINFNKKDIYENLYMYYFYYLNSFDRQYFLKDSFFVDNYFYEKKKLVHKRGDNSVLLQLFDKKRNKVTPKIESYINKFVDTL